MPWTDIHEYTGLPAVATKGEGVRLILSSSMPWTDIHEYTGAY